MYARHPIFTDMINIYKYIYIYIYIHIYNMIGLIYHLFAMRPAWALPVGLGHVSRGALHPPRLRCDLRRRRDAALRGLGHGGVAGRAAAAAGGTAAGCWDGWMEMEMLLTLPSGKLTVCELENGPVEIVSFPINSMVIFHSYVSLPEGMLYTV